MLLLVVLWDSVYYKKLAENCSLVSAAASAAVCGAVDVVVGVAAVISVVVVVVVVVVTVDVRRLQRSRVSAHGMTNGTQELESRIRPAVELGQTGLDS